MNHLLATLIPILRNILFKHRYLHFFITGTSGVLLNLVVVWALATFVFGVERYFTAYVIGAIFNLLYLFTLHTLLTFGTTRNHGMRLASFVLYHLGMTTVQASIIKYVTDALGAQYYLLVIATTIGLFSIGSFIVFKFLIFYEKKKA